MALKGNKKESSLPTLFFYFTLVYFTTAHGYLDNFFISLILDILEHVNL